MHHWLNQHLRTMRHSLLKVLFQFCIYVIHFFLSKALWLRFSCLALAGTYVDDSPQYQGQEKPYKKPRLTERNRCCRYLCCACCLPVWARWILWIIIIAIIIVVIVFGIIFSQFKVPTFNFNGITSSPLGLPQFAVNGTRWDINVGLMIAIDNPNIESATLSDMNATVSINVYSILWHLNRASYWMGMVSVLGFLSDEPKYRCWWRISRLPSRVIKCSHQLYVPIFYWIRPHYWQRPSNFVRHRHKVRSFGWPEAAADCQLSNQVGCEGTVRYCTSNCNFKRKLWLSHPGKTVVLKSM